MACNSIQKSSSSFASHIHHQCKYDVFLSFRGEDTRENFTDHLYSALDQKGIFTFKDDEKLERGKEISSELLKAIEESRFSIIVLSKNYASSAWCLAELAKIVECVKLKGQTVFPVFYNIDPSDVRKQTGDFKKAFDKHEQEIDKEKVQRWRSALKQVSDISGCHLQDKHEAQLIQEIVKEISKRLNQTFSSVAKGLFGIEPRVKELMDKYLEVGSKDVRFIGICGMGGIGKTTTARVLYEMLSNQYEGNSFVANVREVSESRGIAPLQEQLLSDVLGEIKFKIRDSHLGVNLISRRLCRKKVFLVLDDVDQLEQLEALARELEWFGSGSRIIITTRDEHLLRCHGIKDSHIYKVGGLNNDEALKLFHLKAFKNKQPSEKHVDLSRIVVSYTQGLPLALVVLGSYLCNRNVEEWRSAWDRLHEVPNEKIVKVLRISYDALDQIDKKIFLDIACFFKGKNKDKVMEKLESFDFSPAIGVRELIDKSLITISDNKLWMHDLLQEMGWEIIREQYHDNPGKWSRLWLSTDIYRVLKQNMGTNAIEGIMLEEPKKEITNLLGKSFLNMNNLRLLKINNVNFSEDLEYLSNELRFLKWHGYPSNTLPSSFYPEKLFILNLCYSHVEHLWNGVKSLEKLKTIKLSHSYNLIRTPDFTEIPNLERLDLEGCTSLIEVHESAGFLKKLAVLNLRDCKNLVSFPSNVCGLMSLKILILYGCSKLEKLPQNIGKVEYLEELDVSGTAIKQLPPSIVLLTNLKTLFLHGCNGKQNKTWTSFFLSLFLPKRYQDSVCLSLPNFTGLSSLANLDLSDCNLFEGAIPDDLGSLSSLKALDLSRNNFVSLPASINQLSKLRRLHVDKCQRLESLPELPLGIIFVGAEDCTSLERLPDQLKPSTSANILFHFFNCFKLVENQGRNNSLGVLLLKLRLQELSNHSDQFHIRLPGSEIPEWFRHWSNGCLVQLQLPPHWYNDNFMGFVVCAVLALPHYPGEVYEQILCSIEIKGVVCFCFRFLTPRSSTAESDHLWLGYMSHTQFERIQEWEGSCRVIKARFQVAGQGVNLWGVLAKRCAIRLLYKQEVENFGFGHNNFEELPAVEGRMIDDCGYSEEAVQRGSEDFYDDPRLNGRGNF